MAETAAYLVDNIIPRVPVRQWVLSFPIPLRSRFAVHPELLTAVLQIFHRVITTFLIKQTGVKRKDAATGAINLIQRFGSAANLTPVPMASRYSLAFVTNAAESQEKEAGRNARQRH